MVFDNDDTGVEGLLKKSELSDPLQWVGIRLKNLASFIENDGFSREARLEELFSNLSKLIGLRNDIITLDQKYETSSEIDSFNEDDDVI